MTRFDGKVALVTGAAQGIGAAIARLFGEAGAAVIANDHGKLEQVEAVAAGIRWSGGRAVALQADVSARPAVRELVTAAEQHLGPVDILVNNAGTTTYGLLAELSEEEFDQVIDVDLNGPFYCAQAVLPGMIERRSGKVINVASELAFVGRARLAHYCAAKAGLIAMSKALAREVAPFGINVNVVAPGPIQTPIWDVHPEDYKQRALAEIPLGRWGQPEDVARTVTFLASEEASFYSGWVLSPNGGVVTAPYT